MRLVSLVPGATETLCALGVRGHLVGISQECASVADLEGFDVDVVAGGHTAATAAAPGAAPLPGRGRVELRHPKVLSELKPDLVIAPAEASGARTDAGRLGLDAIRAAVDALEPAPRLLTFGPSSFVDLQGSMRAIGEAVDRGAESARLVAETKARMEAIRTRVAEARARPRATVLCSVSPLVAAGGFLAEMAQLAGGEPTLGTPGGALAYLQWDQLVASQPEVVIVAPLALGPTEAGAEADALRKARGMRETPAALWGQVHAVDARRYFTYPGPCLLRGLEILASLVHPELPWPESILPGNASRPVAVD